MKKSLRITITLALFWMLIAGAACADEWALNIYGVSHHLDRVQQSRQNFNEENTGLGVRYYNSKHLFFEAGWFKDSLRDWSSYIGAAAQYPIGPFAVGAEIFSMSRPSHQGGRPFIAGLPFVSLQIGPVVTTASYVPADTSKGLFAIYMMYWTVRF